MNHLTREEILDAAETDAGQPAAGRARNRGHLDACAQCRAEVSALADLLREVSDVEVPEPSPLFWDHFSRRVSNAVREQAKVPARRPWWRAVWPDTFTWRVWAPVGAALFALVLFVGTVHRPAIENAGTEARATRAVVGQGTGQAALVSADGSLPERSEDQSWHVLSALVTEADGEALTPEGPGAAEGAVLQLSDEERGELGRLLEAEMERHRSRVEG
jgi:hypothetical protein